MENFAIFQFFKFYPIFRENLCKNLEICTLMGRGLGAEPSEAREFSNNLIEKSMETCNF